MPVLDGIAAAERIARDRIAPVVILTAFSQRELVERARDAGAMAYLVKPFSRSDLVPADRDRLSRFAELGALETEVARPRRAAGRPEGGRPGQGRAAEGARPERAGRVPLDPEDRDGPAPIDARGRRGRRRARRRGLLTAPGAPFRLRSGNVTIAKLCRLSGVEGRDAPPLGANLPQSRKRRYPRQKSRRRTLTWAPSTTCGSSPQWRLPVSHSPRAATTSSSAWRLVVRLHVRPADRLPRRHHR